MDILFSKNELNNKTVGVAVSGGEDSMVLLHYLFTNAENLGAKIVAVNIDHGMRGEESAKDSEFVKNYCAENKIPFYGFSAKDSDLKLTSEEDAREYRYACFEHLIKNGDCDFIATAHHKSDLVESVLINLFRGTGVSGLKGIPKCSFGNIIRPLLYTDKDEISAYRMRENLPFVTDGTNLKSDYNRNFLRLEVLPKIKGRFPKMEDNIYKLSLLAEEDDEALTTLAEGYVTKEKGGAVMSVPTSKALFARASIKAMKTAGVKKDYEKKHIDAVYELYKNGENGDSLSLPYGVTATIEYGKISFYKKNKKEEGSIPVKAGVFETEHFALKIEEVSFDDKIDLTGEDFTHYIDKDKLPKTAVIRTRKNGDTFKTFSEKTKKLKEFLIDEKVPKRLRDDLLLVADGSEILYVGGKEISCEVKVEKTSKTLLKLVCVPKI